MGRTGSAQKCTQKGPQRARRARRLSTRGHPPKRRCAGATDASIVVWASTGAAGIEAKSGEPTGRRLRNHVTRARSPGPA